MLMIALTAVEDMLMIALTAFDGRAAGLGSAASPPWRFQLRKPAL
jgi:hypothetical protein